MCSSLSRCSLPVQLIGGTAGGGATTGNQEGQQNGWTEARQHGGMPLGFQKPENEAGQKASLDYGGHGKERQSLTPESD